VDNTPENCDAPDMARPIARIVMTSDQQDSLRELVGRPTTAQRTVLRARIILSCGRGLSQEAVAREVGVRRRIVSKWCKRFRERGLDGLRDAKGRGRKTTLPEEQQAKALTLATQPPSGYTRWSVRRMAKATGLSVGSVHALWRANDIKPHLTRTFKLSNDKEFERKFWDVIGLYLNPPDKALVLCCDEKSQCQALERTQPGLPLGMGHIKTRTHDYIRHGTLTLFAALNYLDGKILSQTAPRHTHKQWLAFLKHLDKETPPDLTLHLIIDNYGTHKAPKVKSWMKWRNTQQQKQHGADRLVMHFTPTSSSWMNLVERFFRDLSEDTIREGSFSHVRELESAINEYLAQRNLAPKRYVWKKKGEEILAKIQRARTARAKQEVKPL
jgi:transposase